MFIKTILISLLLLTMSAIAHSQGVPGPFDANSFSLLNDKRTQLNILIPDLEGQVYNYDPYDRDTLSIQAELVNISKYIERLSKRRLINSSVTDSVESISNQIDMFTTRATSLKSEHEKIRQKSKNKLRLQKTLDSAKVERSNIEYKLNQLMIPKLSQQNFMFWSSLAFVILMCILLFTFFNVINKDEGVRRMIFGSDSGIQFVTLFSIVIAIILFGLTGVLEGKELAALLGSVAGYILGKANFSNEKAVEKSDTIDTLPNIGKEADK